LVHHGRAPRTNQPQQNQPENASPEASFPEPLSAPPLDDVLLLVLPPLLLLPPASAVGEGDVVELEHATPALAPMAMPNTTTEWKSFEVIMHGE
jgi:hypothetical protein